MKVLHLVKTAVGATWAWRQMRELVQYGHEVHVALPPGPMVERYRAAGVNTHLENVDFPIGSPWRIPGVLATMRRLVEAIRPDIIHSHFVGTTLTMRLALGKRHSVPRLFQVPGPLHLEHTLFKLGELATAGPADYWIGSCKWTCDVYRRSGVEPGKVFLSYYGTDLAPVERQSKGALRAELGLGAEELIVGMVAFMYSPKRYLGQTRGLKGHEDLIDAIALLRQRGVRVKCAIIGGAWSNGTAYEKHVREYGRQRCGDDVIFLGTRSDVPALYPDFSVAVHPSHSENIGGAGESLLFGIPTVATNVGGFPDVVIPGETGWLVPPKSPDKLADAIEEVIRDQAKARAMALQGRSLIVSHMDVRTTALEVAKLYELVSHGTPRLGEGKKEACL